MVKDYRFMLYYTPKAENMTPEHIEHNPNVAAYFKSIRNFTRIGNEEDLEYLRRIKADPENKELVTKLIESKVNIPIHLATKFLGRGMPFLDLIQEGNIGLLNAVRLFDEKRNVRFTTFAFKLVRQNIYAALTNKLGIVRIPYRVKNPAHYGKYYGLANSNISSIDDFNHEEYSLGTRLNSTDHENMVQEEYRGKLKAVVNALTGDLKQVDREIVEHLFGLNGNSPRNFREVGKTVGFTKQNVHVRYNKTLCKFRQQRNLLKEYAQCDT